METRDSGLDQTLKLVLRSSEHWPTDYWSSICNRHDSSILSGGKESLIGRKRAEYQENVGRRSLGEVVCSLYMDTDILGCRVLGSLGWVFGPFHTRGPALDTIELSLT